jgi:HlyD family secretion protein
LRISLTESGSIQSRERVIIRSEVEGRRTILTLIDEGKYVHAGDLLIEIDSSGLEESRLDQQIRAENAEAQWIGARENLSIVSNAAQALIDDAEMALRFARIEMEKFEKADYAQQLQQAAGDITIAQEELQRSEDRSDWSRRLMEQGYLTRMEMQADQLSAMRARLGLELARSKMAVLTNYTYAMTQEKLAREIVKSEMALARARMKASADLIQAGASARASQSESVRQNDRLSRTILQIEKCRVVAPSEGMVVYATSMSSRRYMQEPLRPGVDVVERQELIYLPATRGMMAMVQMQEHNLPKLREHLPAEIRVSALPGRVFHGHIERIGIMPDSSLSYLNPDIKLYDCHVWIDEVTDMLRQGMSCRVEILIEEYEDAVFVPVQCVVRVDNRPTVYVMEPGGVSPREVEVGLDNNRMMRIVKGLEPGERVLLAPPIPPSDAMGVRVARPEMELEMPNGTLPPAGPAAGGDRPKAREKSGGEVEGDSEKETRRNRDRPAGALNPSKDASPPSL